LSTAKDPTVADVIETMTKNEKKALYNIVTEICNRRFHSSKTMAAVLVIDSMNDDKKRVAYYLIGLLVETKKSCENIIDEIQKLFI
jgi:hypothetical protein